MDSILVITGPTAVGKTSISLDVAESIGADIISCDSRQIYKELNIGTAKPNPFELERIRHHFINELSLSQPFSAGAFARSAWDRIRTILELGKKVLIVGGSTLYLQALVSGLDDIPPVPSTVRTVLSDRLKNDGSKQLYDELVQVDPVFANTVDPSKTQRIIRGLEVYYSTGLPLSSFHGNRQSPPYSFKVVVLNRNRQELYDRINNRVDVMIEQGLVQEVTRLINLGYDKTLNPLKTIGYKEVISYLEGDITHEGMVALLKRNSRRYAKRQMTWFRRDNSFHTINIDNGINTDSIFQYL